MQIDWWTLAIQTINFLIVVWLLRRFLYAPVQHMIDDREAADRAAAEEARKKTEAAETLKTNYEAKLAAFEDEMRKREAESHKAAAAEGDRILEAARAEAAETLAEAKDEIEASRGRAITGLKAEITDLARDLARAALTVNASDPVACLAAALDAQSDEAIERLRLDLSDGGSTVMTAWALRPEVQESLSDLLHQRLGDAGEIQFGTDPSILGGIILKLRHGIFDASVAGRLDDAAARLSETADVT